MPQFDLRKDYTLHSLDEQNADPDPFRQFALWYEDAEREVLGEANAASLATASPDGAPSARIVLLKDFDERGFVFYTNYESRKGRELAANPQATLLFFWPELQRQVRIEGTTTRVSAEEAAAYFATRPRESQIGAWASRQSEVLPDRVSLEERIQELAARYQGRQGDFASAVVRKRD